MQKEKEFQVEISRKAQKEIQKLQGKDKARVYLALIRISENPYLGKHLRGKLEGCYSYRVWPFRILYLVYKKKLLILVVRVEPRQGVYK